MKNEIAKVQIEAIRKEATKKTAHPMVKLDSKTRLGWMAEDKELSPELRTEALELQSQI